MLLTIEKIEEKALEIYQKSIKDRRIPEDFCADIYILFKRRMLRKMENSPKTKEVSEAYAAEAVKYIIRDLYKKHKLEQDREEELISIQQSLYGNIEQLDQDESADPIFQKLGEFIETQNQGKKSYQDYTRIFLLYYSYYLPLESLIIKQPWYFKKETMELLIGNLRDKAIQRYGIRRINLNKKINRAFYKLLNLRAQMYMKEKIKNPESMETEHQALVSQRDQLVGQWTAIEIVPCYRDIARALGLHEKKVRYGLDVFCTEFLFFLTGKKRKRQKAA